MKVWIVAIGALAATAFAAPALAQIPTMGGNMTGQAYQAEGRENFRQAEIRESLRRRAREDFLTARSAYDHGDWGMARKLLLPMAEQDSPAAQYLLGAMEARGQGGPRNKAAALSWFRKAAGQGFPQGEFNLGLAYLTGDGVAADDREGARWLRRAADHGLPQAQFNLAVLYENGQGVTRDTAQARAWYRRAAAGGVR